MKPTSRREFLRVVSVTASATALGLAGCDGSSNSSDPAPQPGAPQILAAEARFPQGVASGDPRPDAILLWTRADGVSGNGSMRLQVATDSGFASRVVDAPFTIRAEHDHCLKVRVLALQPGRTYYYRFLLEADGNLLASATGRTRTARAAGDATPARFAFVSCQDYIGRYYNALQPLLAQDLDFVLHLGDAIYETTGNPEFQSGGGERVVEFRHPEQALRFGSGAGSYLAARSLDNYRDLHRTYRRDPVLRQLYQMFPVVAIWDDHEFSDDSWRDSATYVDGRHDERDGERRRNAEQAYFEFMPVDTDLGGAAGAVEVVRDRLHPNTVLYRKLRFGRDVELFLTDYRSFRPDHLIPEDAFPGGVPMDRQALTQALAAGGVPYAAVRDRFSPYLDIDLPAYAVYKQVLLAAVTGGYVQQGIDLGQAALRAQSVVSGNVATTIINSLVSQYNAQVPPAQRVPPLPQALIDTLDTGVAWFTLGKTSLFGSLGSRYFVVKEVYDLYAAWRLATRGMATQDAWGRAQTEWLVSQVAASTARWKVIATSVSFTSMQLDLSAPALGVPPPLNQRFYINVDQWDGFPQTRDALLRQALGAVPGVVFLSGDIHAGFATVHAAGPGVSHAEFTTPAISSATFTALIANAANSDPLLAPLAATLLPALDALMRVANPAIAYAQSTHQGSSVAEFGPDSATVHMFEYASPRVLQSQYAAPQPPDRTRSFRWNGSAMQML